MLSEGAMGALLSLERFSADAGMIAFGILTEGSYAEVGGRIGGFWSKGGKALGKFLGA
jgi:hypothetical protein